MSIFDTLRNIGEAAGDIIDLYFIQSDLKDINFTPSEKSRSAYYDAMSNNTSVDMSSQVRGEDTPSGMQVW